MAEEQAGVSLCYVGEAIGIERELARRSAIPFRSVDTGQIRGRLPWDVLRNLGRMRRGASQCREVIREFRPDVAFVTGGYVAAPVAWATWRAKPRIPLLIYLPDLEPGLAIRLTSRLAAKVAVSFPEAARHFPGKAVVTGYPVRQELLFQSDAARQQNRVLARRSLNLREDLPVLLVFGGSRGARSINRALVAGLPTLLPRCQVVHISGELDWPWVEQMIHDAESGASGGNKTPFEDTESKDLRARYHPYPYLHEEMVQALLAADLVMARAGASVLGEFPAAGLPSILVPYPYAGQHQDVNAAYLADRGAAVILPDSELSSGLVPVILRLLDAPAERAAMRKAATSLAQPAAARNIARELCKLANPAGFHLQRARDCAN